MSGISTLALVLHIEGWFIPESNDCFAMPLEASRPAKFPYIPSSRRVKILKHCETKRLTGSIEIPSRSDVEHSPIDGQQNSSAIFPAERL